MGLTVKPVKLQNVNVGDARFGSAPLEHAVYFFSFRRSFACQVFLATNCTNVHEYRSCTIRVFLYDLWLWCPCKLI